MFSNSPTCRENNRKMSALMLGGYNFEYQTAITTMEYTENGIQFLEKMVCTIED